ncbi:MAG TPA: MOSC domain-containing protein [Burkholderiales bacterium]|nr:MOSC domain-containing protein [Burkholderiales bacterium]
MKMNLVSVNAGLPREVKWNGTTVTTSIWKSPVSGPVRVSALNIAGDRQSDLSVHGGADKAVYVYPSEHYDYWRRELPGVDLPWGAFGENLTTTGLSEEFRIGDRLKIGTAEFAVTQPRLPCYKLAARFGRADMVKRFMRSGRTGFYLRVTRQGEVEAGDSISVNARAGESLTVGDIVRLHTQDAANQQMLMRAANLEGLAESWREYFRKRAREHDGQT